MHSKNCCALFLLALVACQAAPSLKTNEKLLDETENKLAKEDLNLEDTGADKDRAKKSTTFCVEVHSGKEEVVPCKQEVKQTPVINTSEYKPVNILHLDTPAPAPLIQYPVFPGPIPEGPKRPVPNFNPIIIQPSHPIIKPQQTSQVVQTLTHIPVQSQQPLQSSNLVVSQSMPPPQRVIQVQTQPQYIETVSQSMPPPQHVIQVQTQPQYVETVSPVQSQQSLLPLASVPAPTPIINIIPAPASAPCEKTNVVQPSPQPQPAPQPILLPTVKPIKLEGKRPKILPIPHQNIHHSCNQELLFTAPSSPVEFIYEKEPTKIEYVPAVSPEYECTCRADQRSQKIPIIMPSSGLSLQRTAKYNSLRNEDPSHILITQARETEGRHHHNKKIPLHLSVQPIVYSSSNNPKYESGSYYPATYGISPYTYATYGSYPVINYGDSSYSNEIPHPYNVPITVNAGGPFYRNSQDENSDQEFSTDNKSTQEPLSNVSNLSSNQKREAISTELKNDEQKETVEGLLMEKENSIKQAIPKTDQT